MQDLYDNDLKKIVEYHLGVNVSREAVRSGQVLGAEATLWSEKVRSKVRSSPHSPIY